MNEISEQKNHSLTLIALLAMLVISLFLANYMVQRRTQITLSDPIILSQLGLSIAMPEGPGWNNTPWQPASNAFVMLGVFNPQSVRPQVQVVATLRPTPVDIELQDIINFKAAQLRAENYEIVTEEINGYTAYSVSFDSPAANIAMAFSILTLDDKLHLELEIVDITGNSIYADELRDTILRSVEFDAAENPLPNGE